jgi:hypothetical protein
MFPGWWVLISIEEKVMRLGCLNDNR